MSVQATKRHIQNKNLQTSYFTICTVFLYGMVRYNSHTSGFIWIFYSWNKILRLCVEIINYFYVFQPRSHFVIYFYVLISYACTSLQWWVDNIDISGWIIFLKYSSSNFTYIKSLTSPNVKMWRILFFKFLVCKVFRIKSLL